MVKSFLSYEGARKVSPGHSTVGSLAWLHELAWRTNDISRCFRRLHVERDETPVGTQVPENPFVLSWSDGPEPTSENIGPVFLKELRVKSVLVRQEYLNMLRDIINICVLGTRWRPGETEIDDKLDSQDPFATLTPYAYLEGVTVLGSPGIGKSTFLAYVLARRVLSGKPTVFQSSITFFVVLNSEGVFEVPCPNSRWNLEQYIEPGTWFLVDSNQSLKEVSEYFTNQPNAFVVQAASPCKDRVQWTKKAKTARFWMAPWSLGELIAARDLQVLGKGSMPSESQLSSFCDKYGTSPRLSFYYATEPELHEIAVFADIGELNRGKVLKLLRDATSATMDDTISHFFIVVTPHPDNRMLYQLDMVSEYLINKVLDLFSTNDKDAALSLYWIFLTNSCSPTCAGYLLKKAFTEQFPRGGFWAVTQMKMTIVQRNAHWTYDAFAGKQYLTLGYGRKPVEIRSVPPWSHERNGISLAYHEFDSNIQVQLENGFFRVKARNQALFDSFVFDASTGEATLFQVTVAKSHNLASSGLERVKDAKFVDLVVVTCPRKFDGAEDIKMSAEYHARIRNVYLLELEM